MQIFPEIKKLHSNNKPSGSKKLLGNNVESIIKSGIALDSLIPVIHNRQKLTRTDKECRSTLFSKDENYKCIKELFKNIEPVIFCPNLILPEHIYLSNQKVILYNNKLNLHSEEKDTFISKCEILSLFDLLIMNLNELQLTTSEKPSLGNYDNHYIKTNLPAHKRVSSNLDKYIVHEINDFLGIGESIRSNKCLTYSGFLNCMNILTFYYESQNILIEIFTQIMHMLTIFIKTNDNCFNNKIKIANFILFFMGIILLFLEFFYFIFNWKIVSKVGVILKTIHLIIVCENKYLKICKSKFNAVFGVLLFYSYFFCIIFILQCKYLNKYYKFQVTEIIRMQLKQFFFSFDDDMDSMISTQEFENICLNLEIKNLGRYKITKMNLYSYLFKTRLTFKLRILVLLFYNGLTKLLFGNLAQAIQCYMDYFGYLMNNLNPNFKSLTSKTSLFFGHLNVNSKYFEKFEMIIKLHKTIYPRKRKIETYEEFICEKSKISYQEFEMLLISLDKDRRLINKIESSTRILTSAYGPYLLVSRKIWYEQLFFTVTIMFCILIAIIHLFEADLTVENYYSHNIFSSRFICIYTIVILLSSVLHYKTDMHYYSSMKNYYRVLQKCDSIQGYKIFTMRESKRIQQINKHKFCNFTVSSDILGEFLSNRSAKLLEECMISFSKYLPMGIATSILRNCESLSLRAQSKEITILFSDIVGFTKIAEKTHPLQLFELLTDYFDEMTKIIDEFRGNLLEIVGDAILVIWNSPITIENHSTAAVYASLRMKKLLQQKSKSFGNICLSEINIKCGIHTDRVLIGNIGGSRRMKYGIMGDGVNLASRIESLSKRYSADIIISDRVFSNKNVQENFVICPLDIVIVQGKSNPTVLFHVISTFKDSNQVSLMKSKLQTKALIFFINRDFERSLFYINKINTLSPYKSDPTTSILFEKSRHFLHKNLGINWSCAEVLETKVF
ncbi:adenylate/guanylate cyclase domain-containing protein [Cryptosporidium felis]|nr:adenylate/guanylate cyclase domain-containing protein [Cryptosporidium felis]